MIITMFGEEWKLTTTITQFDTHENPWHNVCIKSVRYPSLQYVWSSTTLNMARVKSDFITWRIYERRYSEHNRPDVGVLG